MRYILLIFPIVLLTRLSSGMQKDQSLNDLSLNEKVIRLTEIASLQRDILKALIDTREDHIKQVSELQKKVEDLEGTIKKIADSKKVRHEKNKRRRARTK